ncbi:MAG: hypothetical protein ABIP40_16155 [Bacteroidia bacterium]
MSKDVVFFKNSDTSLNTQKIPKNILLLVENYKGDVFIFSEEKKNISGDTIKLPSLKRNIFGVQPFAIFFGRGTFVYERMTKDDKIGFVFPLSITFDPSGKLYKSQIDTSQNSIKRLTGVNFIGGMDVNFYVGRKYYSKFFLGPRIRYGTDMFLRGIEAYSIQTQFGWKLGDPEKRFVQHFSLGFGFVRILSSPAGTLISPKQSFGWYSINYRAGIKW